MRRIRCSIANLLRIVLFTGIALAALRSGSALWGSLLFTSAVSALLVAVVTAVYRRDERRAFWLGFALFGWGYVLSCLVPEARSQLATTALLDVLHARIFGLSEPALVTWSWSGNASNPPDTFATSGTPPPNSEPCKIQDLVLRHPPVSSAVPALPSYVPSAPEEFWVSSLGTWISLAIPPATTTNLVVTSTTGLESFQRIGHALFSIVFALLGAIVARRLDRTSRPSEATEP